MGVVVKDWKARRGLRRVWGVLGASSSRLSV